MRHGLLLILLTGCVVGGPAERSFRIDADVGQRLPRDAGADTDPVAAEREVDAPVDATGDLRDAAPIDGIDADLDAARDAELDVASVDGPLLADADPADALVAPDFRMPADRPEVVDVPVVVDAEVPVDVPVVVDAEVPVDAPIVIDLPVVPDAAPDVEPDVSPDAPAPIDYASEAQKLALLATGPEGFAEGVVGGLQGGVCRVTNLQDDGRGSLRDCVENPFTWVVFDVDGVIELGDEINMRAENVTVDGRGREITLRGKGIRVGANIVIIHNIAIVDGVGDEADAVRVTDQVQGVWLNHLLLRDFPDELLDVHENARGVTLSWSLLGDGLVDIGEGPEDAVALSVHNSIFRNARLKVSGARVHVYNVHFGDWEDAAVTALSGAVVLLEHCAFVSQRSSTVTLIDAASLRHRGLQVHVALPAILGEQNAADVWPQNLPYGYTLELNVQNVVARLPGQVGPRPE